MLELGNNVYQGLLLDCSGFLLNLQVVNISSESPITFINGGNIILVSFKVMGFT